MALKQITSSRVHPTRRSMKEGEWRFAMTGGKPGRLFHKFSGILHEWPTIRNLDDYLLKSGGMMLDGAYIAVDEIRARDGHGLKLYDDGGNGIFVKDGGNVGVFETNPLATLQVGGTGNFKLKSTISSATIRIDTRSGGYGNIYFEENDSDRWLIGYRSDDDFQFYSYGGAGEVMRLVYETGNVGIGTSTPGTKLEVAGDSTFDGQLIHGEDMLTISGGEVTVVRCVHRIETEGLAATDDLDTINGGIPGMIVTFYTRSSNRDVTFKDGTGNMQLGGDFTLVNRKDTITLMYSGQDANWLEISRSTN